jgi:hypothetical protein
VVLPVQEEVGDTEYGIGWLPLGGYVKISGMVDESMDKAQMAKPPEPWEFRSKPAWQRLIIMVGGVTVNLLLGMLIYIGVLFTWGRDYLPTDQAMFGIHPSKTLSAQGVQEGDRLVRVEGVAPKTIGDAQRMILIDGARDLELVRGGDPVRVQLDPEFGSLALGNGEKEIMAVRLPFYVDTVRPGMNAAKSDLRKGDRILAVDGTPTLFFEDFRKLLQEKKGPDDRHRLGAWSGYVECPCDRGRFRLGRHRSGNLFRARGAWVGLQDREGILRTTGLHSCRDHVWHGNTHGLREFHEVALHEVRCGTDRWFRRDR